MNTAWARVESAIDVIQAQAVEGGFVTGGQVARWVLDEGEVATAAVGADARGVLLEPDSQHATYCMIKPIMTLLYGHLVEQGEVSLDDRLGDILACSNAVGSFTVADYLTHAVVLKVPDGKEAVLTSSERYASCLLSAEAVRPQRPRYSEFASWRLLALAAEEIVGTHLVPYVTDHVLEPIGAADGVWLGPWGRGDPDRLRVNGAMALPGRFTPLLAERGDWFDWATNPGFGGYLSATSMVKVVGELVRSARGGGLLSPTVAAALLAPGVAHEDEVIQRTCQFGRGVFANMQWFDLGHLVSEDSFGQVGLMGMSAAVAEPSRGIVAAYHLSSYTDTETMSTWLRPAILEPLLSRG